MIQGTKEHLKDEVQNLRAELKQVKEHGQEETEISLEMLTDLAEKHQIDNNYGGCTYSGKMEA